MSLHTPVTSDFVSELVQRMRGNDMAAAVPAARESELAQPDDDCRDIELAAPTPNGAGPLVDPVLSPPL